jgi:hypothetical protein
MVSTFLLSVYTFKLTPIKLSAFSDASGVGYGGYIAKEAEKSMLGEVYGAWDAPEACMSSTWRELEG